MALDRAVDLREDPGRLAQLLRDPKSRAVSAIGAGVLMDDGVLVRTGLPPTGESGQSRPEPILLGLEGDRALFGLDLETLDPLTRASLSSGRRIAPLREAGATLPHSEAGLAAYLMALLNWHRTHHYCSSCGGPTTVAQGGYSRRCEVCGATHFPRTDPAVIVLVQSGDRVLLGRHAGWPEGQYSILAGFVSPGESLEEAVAREVLEESGIEILDPRFVTSQPWPFPSSLMLGFEAHSEGGEPIARDGELEDVAWFTRDEVGSALAGSSTELRLPPSISIARFLLERWWQRAPAAAPSS